LAPRNRTQEGGALAGDTSSAASTADVNADPEIPAFSRQRISDGHMYLQSFSKETLVKTGTEMTST
jgi:hypothetical protein